MLYNSFARIGIEMPTALKRGLFATNEDETELNDNLQLWAQTNASYRIMTGQQGNVGVAAGAIGRKEQFDLTTRMRKALDQHKVLLDSKTGGFEHQRGQNGLITQSI